MLSVFSELVFAEESASLELFVPPVFPQPAIENTMAPQRTTDINFFQIFFFIVITSLFLIIYLKFYEFAELSIIFFNSAGIA